MTITTNAMLVTRTTGGGPTDRTSDATHYVLGGGHVGASVAERLRAAGHRAVVVDDSAEAPYDSRVSGDPSDVDVLEAAGVGSASLVVVATRSDRRNFLVAQLVRVNFDVPRIVVLVHDPDRLSLFEAAGHEPICATTALTDALARNS